MLAGYRYPTTIAVCSDGGTKYAHHSFTLSGEHNLCIVTRGGLVHLQFT